MPAAAARSRIKRLPSGSCASPVPIHTNTHALLVSLLCVFQGTRHMTLRRQLQLRGSGSGCLLLDTTAIGGRPSTNEGSKSNCGKLTSKWVCFWLGLPGGSRVKSIVYFYNVRIRFFQKISSNLITVSVNRLKFSIFLDKLLDMATLIMLLFLYVYESSCDLRSFIKPTITIALLGQLLADCSCGTHKQLCKQWKNTRTIQICTHFFSLK